MRLKCFRKSCSVALYPIIIKIQPQVLCHFCGCQSRNFYCLIPGLSAQEIVGITFGGLIIIMLAIIVALLIYQRRKYPASKETTNTAFDNPLYNQKNDQVEIKHKDEAAVN